MNAILFDMKINRKITILLFFTILFACKREDVRGSSTSGVGGVVGANYTDNGIQWFTVDGAAGMRLGTYSGGGGHVCCASYPRTWTSHFRVKVKWARSDGRERNGTAWKIKQLEKIVAVEKYIEEGDIYVLFFPHDEVKVFVSTVGIGNADFPTNPGYPEDAEKLKE